MWHVSRVLAALPVVWGFVFMPVSQGIAENIYCWKDPRGALCFSNVSPPGGILEFSIMTSTSTGSRAMASAGAAGDESSIGTVGPGKDGLDAGSDPVAAFLRDRIRHRRSAIEQMEALLKSHSDDDDLRKRLFERKQQLHEDIIRLKLMPE